MCITFEKEDRIFTLHTKHTTYQMKVDDFGFLLHLYYGKKAKGSMDYMLTFYDRGFSGQTNDMGNDRTYSMDALPQEFPVLGNGDYRSHALVVEQADGTFACDLRYKSHTVTKGKYSLPGLPAVYAAENEAETLEIVLEDQASQVQVSLLYGVLADLDIITRSV